MQVFIFLTLIAIGSTAPQVPTKNYLPSSQGTLQGTQGASQPSFLALSQQNPSSLHTGNRRPQQDAEKNAVVLKHEQEISESGGFQYTYETSNNIQYFESGNEASSQGGFSYKGDDGKTYTITFTAGQNGFIPQGDHLPQLPEDVKKILQAALEQNAKDEAVGIFDDGQYHPENQGAGANGNKQGLSSATFSSSSTSSGFSSANHQGTFNSKNGYNY